jgi:1,2-dihydroxy-3-keto-5-methylthiopentene dioxygenase
MAVLRIPEKDRTISGKTEVAEYLGKIGIEYNVWQPAHPIKPGASQDEILEAYSSEIEDLKARGGYVTADVISVTPQTPNLDAMLAKFSSEHWHDEDEVRFIIEGRGLFHIRPRQGPVVSITVEAGDLICVQRGTLHWFDLCQERRIRAIRLFQDSSGWTPHYTESGVDKNYQAVCFGPSYLPPLPALG